MKTSVNEVPHIAAVQMAANLMADILEGAADHSSADYQRASLALGVLVGDVTVDQALAHALASEE